MCPQTVTPASINRTQSTVTSFSSYRPSILEKTFSVNANVLTPCYRLESATAERRFRGLTRCRPAGHSWSVDDERNLLSDKTKQFMDDQTTVSLHGSGDFQIDSRDCIVINILCRLKRRTSTFNDELRINLDLISSLFRLLNYPLTLSCLKAHTERRN